MAYAHDTWNEAEETLDAIENRIHDNVPPAQLLERGKKYAHNVMGGPFQKPTPVLNVNSKVVEIGSGVGYIMQGMMGITNVQQIHGLDIAENMITHAKERVLRDGLDIERYQFVHYDGVNFPFTDSSVDMFYSVAAIQHIPKPFAYNIFYEIQRCLKANGWAVIHLIHWDHLNTNEIARNDFPREIKRQIHSVKGHWHHYYNEEELSAVLGAIGIKPEFARVGASFWVRWKKG